MPCLRGMMTIYRAQPPFRATTPPTHTPTPGWGRWWWRTPASLRSTVSVPNNHLQMLFTVKYNFINKRYRPVIFFHDFYNQTISRPFYKTSCPPSAITPKAWEWKLYLFLFKLPFLLLNNVSPQPSWDRNNTAGMPSNNPYGPMNENIIRLHLILLFIQRSSPNTSVQGMTLPTIPNPVTYT